MRFHCTALAVAALMTAGTASAQPAPAAPGVGEAAFSIFLKGTQIGREQVSLGKTDSGWVITATGRTGSPVDFTISRFEIKYAPDWHPLEMSLEARLRNAPVGVRTSFTTTTAINEITQNGSTVSKEDQVSARTIVMPNNVFGSYEALAARLSVSAINDDVPVYVVPQTEIKVKVRGITGQTLTGPDGSIPTRRYDLTFQNPGTPLNAILVVDGRARLVRFEIPDIALLVVREDASSVAIRPETTRNPTDADVSIPANGFNLAGTLTTPPGVAGRLHHPAVVLIGGATPPDRDDTIGGVPVFAQIAKSLADTGHVVLRYDRRGAGQSGGRTETVTLADYADDAAAAVKWLSKRDDVDRHRIVVAGLGDGGAVALLAAAREKGIDGVVTLDASGSRGADLLLRQQERVLDGLKLPPADRQARIDLQKKILAAVASGTGWEGVPAAMRRQADTPWFKSVLSYDPAQALARMKQPILIVQAGLDTNVPAQEADRLADLARARKKAAPVEAVHIPDNDPAPAAAGSKTITGRVADAIAEWIKKL